MKPLKPSYPVDLYLPNTASFFAFMVFMFMIGMGYYAIYSGLERGDWIFAILGLFLMGAGLYYLIGMLLFWFLNKPSISINRKNLIFLTLFKPNNQQIFTWNQIQSIDLASKMDTKNTLINWFILIQLKNGQTIERGIKPLKYNDLILNEKQIFDLIQQAFNQRPLTISNIDMTLNDRVSYDGIKSNIKGRLIILGLGILLGIMIYFFQ